MTFTASDLDRVMNDKNDERYDYGDKWYWLHYETDSVETKFGTVQRIETNKTYRAEYEFDMYMIIKVDGRFFKKSGYYASFDGQHWDGELVEVEKKPVTREEWVEV